MVSQQEVSIAFLRPQTVVPGGLGSLRPRISSSARESRPMPLTELGPEVGLELLLPRDSGFMLTGSLWQSGGEEDYGNLGPHAMLVYREVQTGRQFTVDQQEVLNVRGPSVYVYPETVDTGLTDVNGRQAVYFVADTEHNYLSFIEWFLPGRKVTILSLPGVTKAQLVAVAESLS